MSGPLGSIFPKAARQRRRTRNLPDISFTRTAGMGHPRGLHFLHDWGIMHFRNVSKVLGTPSPSVSRYRSHWR